MIYLDYSATTPMDDEILDTYIKVSKNFFANTSSLHKLGQEANFMYEKASKEIKDNLLLSSHELIFTSNATEANNLAIFGIVNKYNSGKVITTKIEHPSVFNVYKSLENKFDVKYLNIDKNGLVDLEELKNEIDKNTIIVSIMWVNNIIGTIQNIKEIIEIIKQYPKVKLHIDIVQGLCKVEPNFKFSDVDLLTFSTHKIYGPKGIGGLFVKKGLELEKRLYGSSSQFAIKPGTFDLSLVVCTAKAIKKFYPLTSKHKEYVKELWLYLKNKLEKLDFITINTPNENISYYIMNFSINNMNGETIVHYLESNDIYVSTGSSCASKLKKPEKTIYALTNDLNRSTTSIRVSLSHLVSFKDLDKLIEVLKMKKR